MLGTSGCKSNATDHGASSSKLRLVTTLRFYVPDVSMESLARRLRRRPDDTGGRVSPSGSTASSRKKREALKRLHSSATHSDANITVASELPSYDVSTIDFALTPTTKASTSSSTPTTSTDSPKLNRREQMRHRLNRMLSKTGMKGSRIASLQSIRSSSSIGLGLNASAGGTGTNISDEDDDTSASGDYTPPRRMMRSSIIPNLTVTPTSDGSGSNTAGNASPAASVRTVYRVNPDTGRPAAQQVYNPSFLSPARAKTRGRTPSSPRFLSRRSSASPSPSPRSGASFPRRTSSLRHSKEFPFSPSGAEPINDDSDLYASNPTSPVTDESSRLLPAAAASSPALVSAGGSSTDESSPPQFNKPLPTLPRDSEQPLPISVTPLDDDDVFFDAKSPADAAADAAPSWPLPADRQSVYGGGDPTDPPPLPPMSAARAAVAVSSKRCFAPVPVHEDLPTATTSTATEPEAEIEQTANIFSDKNKIDNADDDDDDEVSIEDSRPTTMLFTPSSSSATATASAAATSSPNTPSTDATIRAVTTTRERSASGSSELSMYGFKYYNPLDENVMELRRKRIAAELRRKNIFGDSDNQQQGDSSVANDNDNAIAADKDGNSSGSSSNSSTASSAVIGDGFLPLDDDEDHVAPLLPPPPADHRRRRFTSHSQGSGAGRLFAGGNSNRDSVVSVMTDATGVSFVTAVEGISSDEDEGDHDQWESTEEDDGVVGVVDVDARVDAAEEGGAESSGHPLLFLPDPPRVEHVLPHRDDVGDHADAENALRIVFKQEESSMDLGEDKGNVEPDTFQLVAKDGTNSSVVANLDSVEEASDSDDDDSDSSSTASLDVEERLPTAEDFNNLPFQVTKCGPPTLTTDLHEDILAFEFNPIRSFWDPVWKMEPDVDIIAALVRPYAALCGLANENITVKFLAKGAWNSVYTVSAVDEASGHTSECIFRCALPGYPWFRMQLEVSTMEYVRMNTTIPVPKVYAFNSSMKNALGLEWLLMEKVNGTSYAEAEKTMSFDAKVELHRTVADWVHQLSQLTFDKMGCLYRRWDLPATDAHAFVIGPMNDWEYTADIRLDLDINRGPFTSKEQYVSSLIGLRIAESADQRLKERAEYYNARRAAAQQLRANPDDPFTPSLPAENPAIELCANDAYTLEALQKVPKYGVALQSLLPFAAASAHHGKQPQRFQTHLYHNDIHAHNIMVDGSGAPVALLDWEGVYAAPHDWTDRYPPLVDAADHPQPPPNSTVFGPMDETRAAEERAWQGVLLRDAYDARLRELRSPVLLRPRRVNARLDAIVQRVRNIEHCYADWAFVDAMKEEELAELLGTP
ncbi:hypothetical protein BK809_0008075 [Diplodia seriata]|uniref:Aminoglycoside phosphotransferase domain-containing protein n=1 Tax=Diplodia seriata TaxID=420778 RepID=A0A1S8BKF1_9PEZI|nr:hypothetical protein BK809_0008075 [Diplodia seriata]